MAGQKTQHSEKSLPQGYRAIPLSEGMAAHTLKLCVVARIEPDPVAGHFVVLRDNIDSRVYLGCILDGADQVLLWTEVWIQSVAGLGKATLSRREALTNAAFDERWQALAEALDALPECESIATEWATRHPLPLFVRMRDGVPVHPVDAATGRRWVLCEDDAVLERAGLPCYRNSPHRYWRLDGCQDESQPLARVTTDAPAGQGTIALDAALGGADGLVPLNPACGLTLVRPYYPLGYGELLAVLGGGTWEGVRHGRHLLAPGGRTEPLQSVSHPGRLFSGPRGQAWRLIETLHLKLVVFSEALRCVRRSVASQQRPLLSLTEDSFRVEVSGADSGLPFLWTARAVLVDPGCAMSLPVSIGIRCFFRMDDGRMTVYRPASAGPPRLTRGDLRLRGSTEDTRGGTIVEGTFRPAEGLTISRRDLIGMRVALADEQVELYGHLEQDRALAGQEWRFRSIGQALSPQARASLRAAEGVLLENVPTEVIPLPSSPCDLHAMAVLGVRTLLTNGKTTLPVAVDEVVSLARAVDAEKSDAPLADRIASLWAKDERWRNALGTHRLTETACSEEAYDCLPPALWRGVLCVLIRMFPGVSAFSTCRDLADARPGALETVFDEALAALDELLAKTRSLLAVDWECNPDVQAVIHEAMNGLDHSPAAGSNGRA